MLSWLGIRDFAIIERLEVPFGPGLTVLTGETGAGKSIVVDALALLLGDRGSADLVRAGAEQADIQGVFELAAGDPAQQWLTGNELAAEGECVLRRTLARGRPSKGWINGRPVPVQSLRELGGLLVDIHGQHEYHALLRRDRQRAILDGYAGIDGEVARLNELYRRIEAGRRRLTGLRERSAADREREARLRGDVAELQALAPDPAELESLESDHSRLAHARDLAAGAARALAILADDDTVNANALLAEAVSLLRQLAGYDGSLAALAERLDEAAVLAGDAVTDLRRRAFDYELDPDELARVDQRLGALHDAARKYRVAPAALAELHGELAAELAAIDSGDDALERLEAEIGALTAGYDELAAQVSALRTEAARRLQTTLGAELRALGMNHAVFTVRLAEVEGGRGLHGRETIEFLVSTNPGVDPGPLNRVASGGELSRISLAIQVTAAGAAEAATVVYDEVDVGVGGRVAEIVGNKLLDLSRGRQVLCVTHQPQVAAKGDRHLTIVKAGGDRPAVSVGAVVDDERIEELARMLGGIRITARIRAHARELLGRNA